MILMKIELCDVKTKTENGMCPVLGMPASWADFYCGGKRVNGPSVIEVRYCPKILYCIAKCLYLQTGRVGTYFLGITFS